MTETLINTHYYSATSSNEVQVSESSDGASGRPHWWRRESLTSQPSSVNGETSGHLLEVVNCLSDAFWGRKFTTDPLFQSSSFASVVCSFEWNGNSEELSGNTATKLILGMWNGFCIIRWQLLAPIVISIHFMEYRRSVWEISDIHLDFDCLWMGIKFWENFRQRKSKCCEESRRHWTHVKSNVGRITLFFNHKKNREAKITR